MPQRLQDTKNHKALVLLRIFLVKLRALEPLWQIRAVSKKAQI